MTEQELFELVQLVKMADDERAVRLLKVYGKQEFSKGKFKALEEQHQSLNDLKQDQN
jgi:hypothetical protein